MTTAVLVPEDDVDMPSFARRVESVGYDALWTGELWGRDAFVALTRAAEVTDSLRLGTAIANVYGRSPATLAQAAASLDRVTDTEVRLGLGTSTQKAIEDLHGVPFENPPRQLHEAAAVARRFLEGEDRVYYDGERFQVADFPALNVDVPVYTAALGPATRRATGRVADGWLPYLYPISGLEEAFETVAETARAAGRDPDDIEVTPQILAAVDDDPEAAKEPIRSYVASYIGTLPNYRNALAQWYPEESEAIGDAWAEGGLEAAKSEVTDEIVFDLGVAGTPETARDQLGEILETSVVDCPIVYVPRGVPDSDRDRTIEELQPAHL